MWEIVSAIVGLFSLLFTAFIEWPRFRSRLNESRVGLQNLYILLYLVGCLLVIFGLISSISIYALNPVLLIGLLIMGISGGIVWALQKDIAWTILALMITIFSATGLVVNAMK